MFSGDSQCVPPSLGIKLRASSISGGCIGSLFCSTRRIHVDHNRNRMDGRNLEPRYGLHEDYPRLRPLLRRAIVRAFRGVPGHPFENGFDLTLRPERLTQPLHWLQPRRIFVNSMSDLFHKEVPRHFIDSVFDTMEAADWHTFQVLTKRSSLMARYLRSRYGSDLAPPHIWLGVSIEDAKNAVQTKSSSRRASVCEVHLIRTSFGACGKSRPCGNRLGHCWR